MILVWLRVMIYLYIAHLYLFEADKIKRGVGIIGINGKSEDNLGGHFKICGYPFIRGLSIIRWILPLSYPMIYFKVIG